MSGQNHKQSANMFIEQIDAHNEKGSSANLRDRTKKKRMELLDIEDETGSGITRWEEINNSPRYSVLSSTKITAAHKIRVMIIFWEFLDIAEPESFEGII